MPIADPNILLVMSEASGTAITNHGTAANVAVGQGVENTDWRWVAGASDVLSYWESLDQDGSDQAWITLAGASGLGTTMASESIAIRFRINSFDTRAAGQGFLLGPDSSQIGPILKIDNATSTGDYDLIVTFRSQSGFENTHTFADLSFGVDYTLSAATDASSPATTTGHFLLDAGTVQEPGSVNKGGLLLGDTLGHIGRPHDFSNYYGFTGRVYYFAYWRGYRLTNVELASVNSDPAANIPLWPSGGPAAPTITDANTDEIIGQAESTTLTGTNFEATQGTGTVKISPTDNIADVNAVVQTTTAWADTSVTFTADFTGTGIAEGGTGYVFVTNDSGQSNSAGFAITRQDLTAPTLTGPAGTATGPTTADLVVSTNEAGGTLYWYLSTSATPPSDTDLKAGTGAAYAANEAVSTTGAKAESATGLTAATTYYLHALQTDAAANDSTIVTSASFTTASLPTITTSALKQNNGTVIASQTDIVANIYNASTGALVVRKTSQSTDGSGILTFSDASMSSATEYVVHIEYDTGGGTMADGVARLTTS